MIILKIDLENSITGHNYWQLPESSNSLSIFDIEISDKTVLLPIRLRSTSNGKFHADIQPFTVLGIT